MKKGIFYILITIFIFSTSEIALKNLSMTLNPIQANFLRFIIALVVLYPLAKKQLKINNYKHTKRDYINYIKAAFILSVISHTAYMMALLYLPSNKASIIYCSNSIFTIIFAEIFLKEKTDWLVRLGIIINFIGLLIIINPLNIIIDIRGFILILLSSITFGIYSAFGKYMGKGTPINGVVLISYVYLFSIIEYIILILLSHLEFVNGFLLKNNLSILSNIPLIEGFDISIIPSLLYSGIFITGIGYVTYFLAMEYTSVTVASLVFFIKPITASIIAYILIGNTLNIGEMIGMCILFLGSMIIYIAKNKNSNRNYKKG